jgi:hypothetical protein
LAIDEEKTDATSRHLESRTSATFELLGVGKSKQAAPRLYRFASIDHVNMLGHGLDMAFLSPLFHE